MKFYYASHHWRLRHGFYLYHARILHARHHHLSHNSNFGVMTYVWDHVFGMALEARRTTI
jgi:sterol desaturase/sphingolipid hydroxylase (fatty acid hydroxylase superfamily)